ncbi:hypothetical protein DPMN_055498 [Dreissena polymorpha]|uniref:Uncharacterized protein n=1 Tax=Dreissena polymorpha TaxID=45954 RepID=A0A9D4CQW8_DREPO|nr:hypothetical protein DPMN_055498 [Dreissena polymorpha]
MEIVDMTSRYINAYVRSGDVPYTCYAEMLLGYAENKVSYNIVSVTVDLIAYERIDAENCSMKERCVRCLSCCVQSSRGVSDVYPVVLNEGEVCSMTILLCSMKERRVRCFYSVVSMVAAR